MPIDPAALSSLAGDYTRRMTSIRGRRVQRLLRREFSGAESVAVVRVEPGIDVVVGRSATGAACCATDGRGRSVTVVAWLHGAAEARATRFDLLKDALPVLDTASVSSADLPMRARILGAANALARKQVDGSGPRRPDENAAGRFA